MDGQGMDWKNSLVATGLIHCAMALDQTLAIEMLADNKHFEVTL